MIAFLQSVLAWLQDWGRKKLYDHLYDAEKAHTTGTGESSKQSFTLSQKGKTGAPLAFLEQQISTRAAVSYVLEVAA